MTTPAPSGAVNPAAAALVELTLPGRTLAFCDETDLTNAATSTMVADIHAWVALILPSDAYPEVEGLVARLSGRARPAGAPRHREGQSQVGDALESGL